MHRLLSGINFLFNFVILVPVLLLNRLNLHVLSTFCLNGLNICSFAPEFTTLWHDRNTYVIQSRLRSTDSLVPQNLCTMDSAGSLGTTVSDWDSEHSSSSSRSSVAT